MGAFWLVLGGLRRVRCSRPSPAGAAGVAIGLALTFDPPGRRPGDRYVGQPRAQHRAGHLRGWLGARAALGLLGRAHRRGRDRGLCPQGAARGTTAGTADNRAHGLGATAQGRNQALPTTKYRADDPGAVRHVDAGVQPEFACQLVAEARSLRGRCFASGCGALAIGSSRASAAKGNDAPAAEELPARLELEPKLPGRPGRAPQAPRAVARTVRRKKGVPSDDHASFARASRASRPRQADARRWAPAGSARSRHWQPGLCARRSGYPRQPSAKRRNRNSRRNPDFRLNETRPPAPVQTP